MTRLFAVRGVNRSLFKRGMQEVSLLSSSSYVLNQLDTSTNGIYHLWGGGGGGGGGGLAWGPRVSTGGRSLGLGI